jgi:pimeloyl-ACP methyl ester carboxylesterase
MRALLPPLLVPLFLTLAGCSLLAPDPRVPMPSKTLREAAGSGCTAVLLPGRWDRLGKFEDQGFARVVEEVTDEVGADLTLIETDAHIGYYRERTILPRLAEDVVGPAVEAQGGPVWMVGISLGGAGSIGYAAEHPEDVAGLVLLAPYLGEDELIGEIRAAGGLDAWQPREPVAEQDFARRIWVELRELLARDTPVYLGYGEADDLAAGHRLLAEALPESRVFRRPGGHDWDVWVPLWRDVLLSGSLCTRSAVISRAER